MNAQVDAAELVAALGDLARTAGKDQSLPMLRGIVAHAHSGHGRLYLTSTNRFVLGQAWLPCEGELKATFLSLESAGVLRALLGSALGAALLERRNEKLAVEESGGGLLSVPVGDVASFPNVEKIVKSAPAEGNTDATLGADLVSALAMIARRRREPLRFRFGAERKPSVIEIGQQYRAMIMPVIQPPGEEFVWSVPHTERTP